MAVTSLEEIARKIKKVRFKKKLFGGISEADMWKKFELLQADYQGVLDQKDAYWQALVDERDRKIAELGGDKSEKA